MKKIVWHTDLIILLLSVFVFLFWMVSQSINVYSYVVIGAIYELLALPILALGIILPFVIMYRIIKRSFKTLVFPILSLVFLLMTFLVLYFNQQ